MNPKNILFFHTYHGRLRMLSEMQTEILLKHLTAGDHVSIVMDYQDIMKSQMLFHNIESKGYIYRCVIQKMQNLLLPYEKQITYIDASSVIDTSQATVLSNVVFNNIEELKKYSYKDIPIGKGIASYLISLYREHQYDTFGNVKEVSKILKVSMDLVDIVNYLLEREKIDLVYVFNGRTACYSPVVLCSEKKGISYVVYEFAFTADKYHLSYNSIPHNIDYRYQEMLDLWNEPSVDKEAKEKMGSSFFENTRKGVSLLEASFLELQRENEFFDFIGKKEVICFFNSSIDEFASVPSWEKYVHVFDDEVDAIYSICKTYEKDFTKQFILRVHPNLKFLQNSQIIALKQLEGLSNLVIYPAESSVFTYGLIDLADKVITFGSTIGVEACFWGKPSICLGLAFYQYLDVSYIPKTKEELFELLNNKSLPAKPQSNTFIYGYWALTLGESYEFKEKGYYLDDFYVLSRKQKVVALFKIIFSRGFIYKFRLFFRRDFYQKLKIASYRTNLLRKLFPWMKI